MGSAEEGLGAAAVGNPAARACSDGQEGGVQAPFVPASAGLAAGEKGSMAEERSGKSSFSSQGM